MDEKNRRIMSYFIGLIEEGAKAGAPPFYFENAARVMRMFV
jgi:hypothetical protein